MSKIVFLDIDGTLVDIYQNMSESTKTALKKAQQNGHKMVICTGRTYTNIYPWLLSDFHFDGVIGSAGAYIQVGDKVIYQSILDGEKVAAMTKVMERYGAYYLLQGLDARYVDYRFKKTMLDHFHSLGVDPDKALNGLTFVEDSTKMPGLESGMYFEANITFQEMNEILGKELDNYFMITGASFGPDREHSGEMTRNGINKATGMERLLQYLHGSQKDSIAVGDGPNDFEMIEYAATGIVMGNGVDALKERADFVTDDIHHHGIRNAFEKYGLI